jgi:hypothetical protein
MTDTAHKTESEVSQGKEETSPGWKRRSNMLALWLMALATIGSAWSGYQSSLWDGIQIFLLQDAAALSRDSSKKAMMASQQRALDAALFVQFAREYYSGKRELAEFFIQRARPEFRQAIQAWVATQPAENPNAPATPFVMPQYQVPAEAEATELGNKYTVTYDQARKANLNSDTYALLGVLFTASLFLAGLVAGFEDKRTRRTMMLFSLAALLIATVELIRLPVAHPG